MIDRKQSPLENCKMMLREVDSMLKLVNSKSATNKTRYVQREINQEFTKAIKILSHRVLYSKDAKVSYESNRLKFATGAITTTSRTACATRLTTFSLPSPRITASISPSKPTTRSSTIV